MSNTSYWTEGEYEYAFLVPQGNINESYKGNLLAVLKEFDKTLYVRSDSNFSGWEEVRKTEEMPALEQTGEKTGWTLSSEQNILSYEGMLEKLEQNLKEAGCSCSFMVINDEPEKEPEGNSEVNLEAEDSEKPTLDENPQPADVVEEKSGKEKKKKKPKSKKSNTVKVGNGTQTNTIRKLKDKKKSKEASKMHGLTTYKVVSDEDNSEANLKNAWKAIGSFIKKNAEIYKDVKPIGYGTKRHWHSWHRSHSAKNFVGGATGNFWLMKLTADLKNKLGEELDEFSFTIEPYEDGNSTSVPPTISTNPKPENTEVTSSKETEPRSEKPSGNNTSEGRHNPPTRKPPEPPTKKVTPENPTPQKPIKSNEGENQVIPGSNLTGNHGQGPTGGQPDPVGANVGQPTGSKPTDTVTPTPPDPPTLPPTPTAGKPKKSGGSADKTMEPQGQGSEPSLLDQIRQGVVLKKTHTETNQPIEEQSGNDLAGQLRTVMKTRREDIEDDEDPVEGDKRHEIMNVLTSRGDGIYIAKLQLTSPYEEVKKLLSAGALCPDGAGQMWLTNNEKETYNQNSDISEKIDEQTLEKCAITGKDGPHEWYVKVITEVVSDEWDDDENEENLLPSVTQMNALKNMKNEVVKKGARLVHISTEMPIVNNSKKSPPSLPQRNAKPNHITTEREDQTAKKGSNEKKPAKFIGLEDNVTTPGGEKKSRVLVLVKYSDIEEIRKTKPKEKVKNVSKSMYKEFNPEKLAKALVDFNKKNGVLKPLMLKGSSGFGHPNVGGYTNVLKNPVRQKYKDTGIEVSTWNLIIAKPNGQPLAENEVEKIQELVKILKDHGVAVRRAKDLKLQ